MSRTTTDADVVRAVLGGAGARPESPVMQALASLQLKAALYDWAQPLLADDSDSPEYRDRARAVFSEMLRGLTGEAALRKASGL